MSQEFDFENLVELCRRTHEETQRSAARAIDHSLVARNWLFGRYIVEYEQHGADRAEYGSQLLAKIASRLQRIGIKGSSVTRLKLYRRFYQKQKEIGPTVSDQLASLASVVTLLTIDNLEERRFYEIGLRPPRFSIFRRVILAACDCKGDIMPVPKPRYSKEEFARRGDEIYDRDISPHVGPDDEGKFVVIDIETGAYEIDQDELAASDQLLARRLDAQIWTRRVGSRYTRCLPRRFGRNCLQNW